MFKKSLCGVVLGLLVCGQSFGGNQFDYDSANGWSYNGKKIDGSVCKVLFAKADEEFDFRMPTGYNGQAIDAKIVLDAVKELDGAGVPGEKCDAYTAVGGDVNDAWRLLDILGVFETELAGEGYENKNGVYVLKGARSAAEIAKVEKDKFEASLKEVLGGDTELANLMTYVDETKNEALRKVQPGEDANEAREKAFLAKYKIVKPVLNNMHNLRLLGLDLPGIGAGKGQVLNSLRTVDGVAIYDAIEDKDKETSKTLKEKFINVALACSFEKSCDKSVKGGMQMFLGAINNWIGTGLNWKFAENPANGNFSVTCQATVPVRDEDGNVKKDENDQVQTMQKDVYLDLCDAAAFDMDIFRNYNVVSTGK